MRGSNMNFFSPAMQDDTKLHHGFLLLELVVSIAVFSMVVLAAAGVMISVFQAHAKAIALKDVLDNARFSLELMTRELRTGTNMQYTTTPPPGCPRNGLEFTSNNQGSAQERFYYWDDSDGNGKPDILMRVAMPSAESIDCNAVPPQQFTAAEVVVDHWRINWLGVGVGPTDGQPRITMSFVIYSRNPRFGPDTIVNLQTTVTARIRDL